MPSSLENFIQALEAVKQDYTCGVCFELCKEPVTLSKCFHIICSEHFEGLKTCPNCKTNLEGCTTFLDERLASCVESAKELSKMVAGLTAEKSVKKTTKNAHADSLVKVNSKRCKTTANVPISGKALEKRNIKGETLLHIACRLGKVDRIIELLNQGSNTNTKDNAGWTPLHEVVQNGRLDLVQLLLQCNTLINVPGPSNETPLHEAVRYKHDNIIENLVRNGANIEARNCKGETPFQLADDDTKDLILMATEQIMLTQSVNIARIAAFYTDIDADDIRVFCASEFRTVHSKLKTIVKHHGIHVEAKFTKKVTHLVVDTESDGTCLSTPDVLQGVVNSVWIITSIWLTKSTEEKLEPFQHYEVRGIGPKAHQGPKRSRYVKYQQLPGLFNGCHFYFHNFTTKYDISKSLVITKQILTKLVTDAGGVVLRRSPNPESIPEEEMLVPFHAFRQVKLFNCSHYIIFKDMYEPMYNMQHLKALPVAWLIECMEKYELCDP